jgi:hypothetical protein
MPTATSALTVTASFLTVLKEPAALAPIPFLQGAISTALVLVQAAQVYTRGWKGFNHEQRFMYLSTGDQIEQGGLRSASQHCWELYPSGS